MPYLHWETRRHHRLTAMHQLKGVHPRRTLDEAGNQYLDPLRISELIDDQIVVKFINDHNLADEKDTFMSVDQLWMWSLNSQSTIEYPSLSPLFGHPMH